MAKPNWLQSLGDTMLASLTTSPTSVTGGDAYQPRAMAEFRKGDVEKAKEIQQKDDLRNLRAMAFGAAVASLPASVATIGWIPTLATEAAGWAGSIGAGYLGNKADQKLGTNWIGPTAGIVGGVLSGAGAYRGMVNAGSKGLLKGSGNMYGSRFRSDVAADMMNNSIKTVEPKTTLSTTPVVRTKIGDLEIDDPNLFYRQGTHHVGDDFLESGVVRAGTINHTPTQQTKGIVLTKRAFEQPMFSKGKLWYGIDDSRYPDVLVASPSTKMQMATAHANPTTNVTKAGIRRIPEGTLTNKEVGLYRWVPGYGYLDMQKPQPKVSYELFQRPSKLSIAERMGIPKGERANLTQDQLEGLEDLMHYNTSGKYRRYLTYNDKTGFARTTAVNRPEGSVPGVKALLDRGAMSKGYETSPVELRTKTGSWTIWPGRKNAPAKFSGGDFPTPEGMGWAPGDLSLMLDGNTGKGLKVIMTSPKVDLISNLENAQQSLIESLPNTIDKNIMRRFWQNNDQVVLPGSYLSGDNGALPLGLNGISAIDQGKGMSGAISEILHPAHFRPHASGLSPDSMLSILKQGQRPGHAVRYGPGFTQLNNSAVYNKHIYDAWTKYKSGAMTADDFKTIFDDWFVPQGGRPLEIKTPSKFRLTRNNDGNKVLIQQEQKPYIIFPHPYVHYKKNGGKLLDSCYVKKN